MDQIKDHHQTAINNNQLDGGLFLEMTMLLIGHVEDYKL